MHSVCIAAIHVTVNNTECYTTTLLWRIYSAGNYNRYFGLYFWSILTTFGVSRQISLFQVIVVKFHGDPFRQNGKTNLTGHFPKQAHEPRNA